MQPRKNFEGSVQIFFFNSIYRSMLHTCLLDSKKTKRFQALGKWKDTSFYYLLLSYLTSSDIISTCQRTSMAIDSP